MRQACQNEQKRTFVTLRDVMQAVGPDDAFYYATRRVIKREFIMQSH